ncbi:MAG: DUF5107 domain-containing protein [bacterium]|nr:DUF5107 domain-containing protein [bacterium]
MSELRVETFRMPAGGLNAPSPLPPLRALSKAHGKMEVHESVPEEARKYLGYGIDGGVLPYTIQDDYDRDRKDRDFKVVVLENETLKATFLLELGGRLWSLIHKPTNRELLYKNPVFQPGNLAIRNAWFSGGVEWNCSIQGHTPFTCSPLFAAQLRADDGTPVLRMYEWERIRGVAYQIDAWLPDGSSVLYVRPRIVNPHDTEIPMYWWSNVAVYETPDVRVMVPADAAFSFTYGGHMRSVPLPEFEGIDRTYPTTSPTSADAFYEIPDGARPWIAALDKEGRGLVQASTQRLRGRKLFVWGMGAGGRHWQEFLSVPGHPYIEIQAGLARTQVECIPMPGKAAWSWLEAYGFMEADGDTVHGDWIAAREHVAALVEELVSQDTANAAHKASAAMADRAPDSIIQRGSGWGALEARRRARTGEPPAWGPSLVFDDESLTQEQAPWLSLIEEGALSEPAPSDAPDSWMTQTQWHALLEKAVAEGRADHWFAWLHLGVMRYNAGDTQGADQAWNESNVRTPSAWALRNLAVSAQHRGEKDHAAGLLREACRLAPNQPQLTVECAGALLECQRYEDAVALCEEAPSGVRDHLRLQILRAKAHLELGHLDLVEAFLLREVEVPDIRECEVTLTDLWFTLHEKRTAEAEGVPIDDALKQRVRNEFPPPAHIDFRMR